MTTRALGKHAYPDNPKGGGTWRLGVPKYSTLNAAFEGHST